MSVDGCGGKARTVLRNIIRNLDLPSSLSQAIIKRLEVFSKQSCYLAGISSLLKSRSETERERLRNQPGLGTCNPRAVSPLLCDQLADLQGDIVVQSNNTTLLLLLLLLLNKQ